MKIKILMTHTKAIFYRHENSAIYYNFISKQQHLLSLSSTECRVHPVYTDFRKLFLRKISFGLLIVLRLKS